MKKIINILFFTTVMICIVGCRKDEKIIPEDTRLDNLDDEINIDEINTDEITNAELISYVDQKINSVTQKNEYIKSSVDNRINMLKPLLDELEKAGCIKEYTYSIDSSYKSFLIEYIGGGKFEVILEEMSEEEN